MLAIAPNSVTVTRPTGLTGDADETTGTPDPVVSKWRVAITSPSGADLVVDGKKEVVDAVLLAPSSPVVEHTDLVADDDTGDAYRVVWVRRRRGLGLDHQRIGLRAVTGAASG